MNKYSSKSSNKFAKLKPPSYSYEFCFVTVSLLFLKLYSLNTFNSLSFFTVCLPVMLYLVITLFSHLLKFIQMMHIEDEKELLEEGSLFGILTSGQSRVMQKIAINLMGYFGLYFLSGQLDLYIMANDMMDQI